MQIELTRKHNRGYLGATSKSFNKPSGNEISLICRDLNRGESEYLYESLMAFLNDANKKMERYFVRHDLAELKKKEDAPERAILAELQILATHAKRLSIEDKRAINSMVTDLKKLFEELR